MIKSPLYVALGLLFFVLGGVTAASGIWWWWAHEDYYMQIAACAAWIDLLISAMLLSTERDFCDPY